MKGFLERTFTSSRQTSTAVHDEKEANIFCSDMVGSEFILRKLKDVQCNPSVVRLEVEDLLTGGDRHQCLMPIVRALVLLDNRDWEYISVCGWLPLGGIL